jgi:hypothetical protein
MRLAVGRDEGLPIDDIAGMAAVLAAMKRHCGGSLTIPEQRGGLPFAGLVS